MKKSESFKLAQFAVMRDTAIANADKLFILRVLMESEDLAAFVEETEEKETAIDEVF